MATKLPASLLAGPSQDGTESLMSILGRIHEERGHFRHITEESLQAEIATQSADVSSSDSEEDEEEEDEEDGEAGMGSRQEQLYAAKAEMLPCIAAAQNEALIALDFISLLLSKESKTAETTMSPALKANIKPGTLGIDMWQNVQPNKEQERVDDAISRGYKMQSLQASADSLLGAATRLEKDVRRETQYWEQVLSVSEKGWCISRMPREKHNLGVRFGFLEALGEFRDRGLAALRADEAGNVVLDKGFGHSPKAIRIRIRHGDKIVGVSQLPRSADESQTTLEARIRHARDSLYEEELFHEMVRESRTLVSYGVSIHESSITLPARLPTGMHDGSDEDMRQVLVDLVPLPLGQHAERLEGSDESQNLWAQSIGLVLRLLLSHTHSERLKRRSTLPSPMSLSKQHVPLAHILRPVMTLLQHRSMLGDIRHYIDTLQAVLSSASIEASVDESIFDTVSLAKAQSASDLMEATLAPLHSTWSIHIKLPERTDALAFQVGIYTSILAPTYGSRVEVRGAQEEAVALTGPADLAEYLNAAICGKLCYAIAQRWPGVRYDTRTAVLAKAKGGSKMSITIQTPKAPTKDGHVMLRCTGTKHVWRPDSDAAAEQGFWAVIERSICT